MCLLPKSPHNTGSMLAASCYTKSTLISSHPLSKSRETVFSAWEWVQEGNSLNLVDKNSCSTPDGWHTPIQIPTQTYTHTSHQVQSCQETQARHKMMAGSSFERRSQSSLCDWLPPHPSSTWKVSLTEWGLRGSMCTWVIDTLLMYM